MSTQVKPGPRPVEENARPGRFPCSLLGLATITCLAGTFALLLYFVPANSAMLAPGFPAAEVATALTTWNAVNRVRTGLAVAGAGFAVVARLRSDVPGDHPAYPGTG
ncbi:hypothetical protein GCM10027258_89010 [Amycolatopsis stemonae]